jgi:hypothetical protein
MSGRTSSDIATIAIVARNTFLSVAIKKDTCNGFEPKAFRMRSKSAETVRIRPEADAHHQRAKQSLERLNAVFEMGVATTSEHQMSLGCTRIEGNAANALCGQAVSVGGKAWREETDECDLLRTSSNSSIATVSTMASGDGMEIGDSLQTRFSSSSCSTVISSDSDGSRVRFNGIGCHQHSRMSAPRNHSSPQIHDDSSRDAPPTTMMIRNIPRRYTPEYLLMDLHDLGFDGTFDFLYIPTDKTTSACVGYAFVNFIDPCWAEQCMHSFKEYQFKRHPRGMSKVARVSVAQVQGLETNLQHFQDAVNASKHKMQFPNVLFSTRSNSKPEA